MKELLDGLVLELRRGVLILGVLSQLNQKEYGYSLAQKGYTWTKRHTILNYSFYYQATPKKEILKEKIPLNKGK